MVKKKQTINLDLKNLVEGGVYEKMSRAFEEAIENILNPNTDQTKKREIDIKITLQPESKFVFRMREGMEAALFESDGGMWKIEAKQAIKEYLETKLESLDIKMSVIA